MGWDFISGVDRAIHLPSVGAEEVREEASYNQISTLFSKHNIVGICFAKHIMLSSFSLVNYCMI
jgi:hypothetical protein